MLVDLGLNHVGLLLFQRLNPNLTFEKFAKKFQNQNFENLFEIFLHIGTEIMYAKFRENQRKTVGGVAI